jgi:Flp pilus assembly pilin Flp
MSERLSLTIGRIAALDLSVLKREEGQGVTEYGIVLAFVAVALAAVLIVLKTQIVDFIGKVGSDLANLPANV